MHFCENLNRAENMNVLHSKSFHVYSKSEIQVPTNVQDQDYTNHTLTANFLILIIGSLQPSKIDSNLVHSSMNLFYVCMYIHYDVYEAVKLVFTLNFACDIHTVCTNFQQQSGKKYIVHCLSQDIATQL